jgi:small subunit ribosomal protein S7
MKQISFKDNIQLYLFSEKFINLLLVDGKKNKAIKLYLTALQLLKKNIITYSEKYSKKNINTLPLFEIVEQSINNCMPSVEVRKVRVAGTTYLVPSIIPKKKQQTLSIRWIIEASKKKKKQTRLSFAQCLADELFDAFLKQGYARNKRNELHRLAQANRAYIRYRWW